MNKKVKKNRFNVIIAPTSIIHKKLLNINYIQQTTVLPTLDRHELLVVLHLLCDCKIITSYWNTWVPTEPRPDFNSDSFNSHLLNKIKISLLYHSEYQMHIYTYKKYVGLGSIYNYVCNFQLSISELVYYISSCAKKLRSIENGIIIRDAAAS